MSFNPTGIDWTDWTWNPVTGCSHVSPGCDRCYAEAMAKRYAGRPGWGPKEDPFRVEMRPERLKDRPPRKPGRVFVCSQSDLFHDEVTDDHIHNVLCFILSDPKHTYQVLTKRPERMRELVKYFYSTGTFPSVVPNLWLGVTTENQKTANERVPILAETPAIVRFVSCEPLLGPIEFCRDFASIHWAIIGGESQPGARYMDPRWVADLVEQCDDYNLRIFFKQWGDHKANRGRSIADGLQQFPAETVTIDCSHIADAARQRVADVKRISGMIDNLTKRK